MVPGQAGSCEPQVHCRALQGTALGAQLGAAVLKVEASYPLGRVRSWRDAVC